MPPKAAPAAKPAAAKPAAVPKTGIAAAAAAAAKPAAAQAAASKPAAADKPAAAKPAAAKPAVASAKAPAKAASGGKAPAKKASGAKAAKPETEEQKAAREKKEAELEAKMEEERKVRETEEEARRENERRMREEMTKLIMEEEDRLRKKEEEKAKRAREYNKRKLKLFEIAFDDELVEVGQMIGTHDDKGRLQRACREGDSKLCPCMNDPWFNGVNSMTSYVEVDAANENESTPLSEASVGGAQDVLRMLLRHGAGKVVNKQDTHGRTPVFRAAFMGKKEAVELLLSYGADPTIRSKENENACDAASDPAIKQCVEAFSMESMQAALQAIELEVAGAWQKPPEPPDPAELVPKTGHCIRIALRGLADTLDNVRKERRRQSLVIDLSGNAQTYLRYRDTNLLMAYKPGDMEPEKVRVALLGSLRFGKPLVIDNMDLVLEWGKMAGYFNAIIPGLWDMVWDGSIAHEMNVLKIVKDSDGDNFKEQRFSQHCLESWGFIALTRLPQVPQEFCDSFFLITTA